MSGILRQIACCCDEDPPPPPPQDCVCVCQPEYLITFEADWAGANGDSIHVDASFDLFQRVHPELGSLCEWNACWQQGSYFEAEISGQIWNPPNLQTVPPQPGYLIPFDEFVAVGPTPFNGVVRICDCYDEYGSLLNTDARMYCEEEDDQTFWRLWIELRWRCDSNQHDDVPPNELKHITFVFSKPQTELGLCPEEDSNWELVDVNGGGDWGPPPASEWTFTLDLD